MEKINDAVKPKRKRRRWLKLLIILSICLGALLLFLSPIVKYIIEKYDVDFIGREVTMDWAYVNPFTGYVHFSNVKVHERSSKKIFFSADGISANFSVYKILNGTYEMSDLTINRPITKIRQDK